MPSSGTRNTVVLALSQALFTAVISIDLTLTGLTGYQLAPDKALATLPFALITVAGAVVTLYASLLMERIGRRWGFTLGAVIGAAGGLVSVWAVIHANFWVFCAGTAAVGVFQAFAQYYRLAAADSVGPEAKARAISIVLTGSVVAAVAGPALAAWSKDFYPALFAGSYLMVFVLSLVAAILLAAGYRDAGDRPAAVAPDAAADLPARPLREVLRQPISLAAIANNVVGGTAMMLVMTAAPLAAVGHHHSIDDGAGIIQWHLVGMFAPSLVASWLIGRFGLPAILYAGMAMNLACAVIAVTSSSLPAYYAALALLGVGWNFMFVGGSTLLAQSYRPSERARVQGMTELIRYVATAAATLAAGPLLLAYGWANLNLAILPMLAVAALMTLAWARTLPATAGRAA
ncbi:putative MFS family arabinose efflux permease [Stella humosa]|uniref:Putative MFS family arabinose efflux permease n=1 Tax=Stella humosa TaxID=94 RepID=A0A3N1KT21_9PROT|nr:MFS transporter [Stella humosa]ROP81408.1 putative MFS family arabinose efflux permease [Stella humosa]BBK32760.1 MFS transporter [Stella humosa]